jgi:hypothetical protein
MNDSPLYTGVDGVDDGVFGNEAKDEVTEKKIQDQDRLIKELTPKLQELLDIIDGEVASVMSIDRFMTATTQSEADIRSELQAAALYKNYLGNLKTKFTLALNETKGKR